MPTPDARTNQSNSVCLHPLNPAYHLQQLSHIPALQFGFAFSPQPALHCFAEHAHKHNTITTPKITTLIFFFIAFSPF